MRKVEDVKKKFAFGKGKVSEKISCVISKMHNKMGNVLDNCKDDVLLVGSAVIATCLLFVIAYVFVDVLGFYVGLIVAVTVITNTIELIQGNSVKGN